MSDLAGRTALVTGGARGQGRAHAVMLASRGAAVVACDIAAPEAGGQYATASLDDLNETVRLVEQAGGRCIGLRGDVTVFSDLERAVATAVDSFGSLDIVVANAAILHAGVNAWELTEAQWNRIIEVDLTGTWLTCKAAIPTMLEQGSGSIVLTASTSGERVNVGMAHYATAKHGVIGLMKALANELGPRGIRVNAVSPGGVNSGMINNPCAYEYMTGNPNATEDDAKLALEGMNLLPVPWVEPDDVAEAVAWLASYAARYVTGIVLPVDAGHLVKM